MVRFSEFCACLIVQQFNVIAINGLAGRAKLTWCFFNPIANRQNGPPSFGLPIIVDDGFAQAIRNPFGSGFVQRFTGQEQSFQARQIVFGEQCRILFFQHTNGRWCAEHDRHFVLFDQAPPDTAIWTCGQSFIHDRGHSTNQGAIDDVTVANYPTNVAGAKESFAGLTAEDIGNARGQSHCVATRVALYPFRFACCTRGVQGVTGVCGIDPLTGHHIVHVLST